MKILTGVIYGVCIVFLLYFVAEVLGLVSV